MSPNRGWQIQDQVCDWQIQDQVCGYFCYGKSQIIFENFKGTLNLELRSCVL